MLDYSKIQMSRIDPMTGLEVPLGEPEKQCMIDALREAVCKSQIKYSPAALASMGISGLTREVIERWIAEWIAEQKKKKN